MEEIMNFIRSLKTEGVKEITITLKLDTEIDEDIKPEHKSVEVKSPSIPSEMMLGEL